MKQGVDESENISINGSDKIPWHDVSDGLPRPDCDKWNHWNSLMFSFTAITTIGKNTIFIGPLTTLEWKKILHLSYEYFWTSLQYYLLGYGHIFPRTDNGKILCIFYSLLGVPINGILIASLAIFFGQKVSR